MAKKKKAVKNPNGRPSKYTNEIADKICDKIATTSNGLHVICKDESMPCVATVFNWLNDKSKAYFLDKYARARELQAELLADEIIEIADDTSNDTLTSDEGKEYANSEWINRSRLRVDARKWKASKLAPKKYGDKLDISSEDGLGLTVTFTETIISKKV